MPSFRSSIPSLALLVLLSLLIGSAHRHTDAWSPRHSAIDEVSYLPDGRLLRTLSLGYESVVADLLWARATSLFGQRYGDSDQDWYPWLYHMMDLVTDLDPEFRAAYKYGGTMLRIDGVFVDQSSLIFQKGARQLPTYWYFPFAIGMNYFNQDRRMLAARYMEQAATVARQLQKDLSDAGSLDEEGLVEGYDGPDYLHNLAVSLYSDSDQLEIGLQFLLEEQRHLPAGRARDAVRIKIIETRYLMARRDALVVMDRYKKQTGRLPTTPGDVTTLGLSLPDDPLGGQWVWDEHQGAKEGSLVSDAYERVFGVLAAETGMGNPDRRADRP